PSTPTPTAKSYRVSVGRDSPAVGDTTTITAQLLDQDGDALALAGRVVRWSSTHGGAFAADSSVTDSAGAASVLFTAGAVSAVVHTVTATDGGAVTGMIELYTLALPPVASSYQVTAARDSLVVGDTTTVTAQLLDQHGDPLALAGRVVRWSSTSGGVFAADSSLTDAAGVATVLFAAGAVPGTGHTITATDDDGVTGPGVELFTLAPLPVASSYRVTAARDSL